MGCSFVFALGSADCLTFCIIPTTGTDVGQISGSVHHSKHRRLAPSDNDEDDDDDDDDEDDEDENHFLIKKNKKFATSNSTASMSTAASTPTVTTPLITSIVPEGQDFKTGDFVVLREDVERESAPIWR